MDIMENMTWLDVKQAVEEEKVLIIIVGSIEQHGPHLPINTDLVIPYEIAKRVTENSSSLVAPPLTYGYKSKPRSGGGESFPGTVSLNGDTVISSVQDIINSFIDDGFKNFLVLNWHLENVPFVYEGIDTAVNQKKEDEGEKFIIVDNPNALVKDEILADVFEGDFPGWEKEHAAIFETSLMLELKEELVKKELIEDDEATNDLPYDIIPVPQNVIPTSGVLWHASKASKEKGKAVVEDLVKSLVDIIEKEF